MRFTVAERLFSLFPGLEIGVLICEIENKRYGEDRLEAILEDIRTNFQYEKPQDNPHIKIWREAFSKLGISASKYYTSIESLLRRVLKGGPFPRINPVVDLYNAVSLKYLVPMGGHAIPPLDGDISLCFAEGGETFVPMEGGESERVDKGEVVYKDESEILTRRWVWRQTRSKKLRAKNKAAESGWEIRLVLRCGEAQDGYNSIGARSEAADGYDPYDFGEPPSIGGYVFLAFPGNYPDGSERLLAGDFRSVDQETWEYDMVIRGNVNALPELAFLQTDGYTDSVSIELRDSNGKTLRTLRMGDSVRLDKPPTEEGNHYWLVVRKTSSGSDDFSSGNPSAPGVTLMQNYPNPFNVGTRISFDVPELSDVSIEIKNILGQKIRAYSLPQLPRGTHFIDWDGTDQHGVSVSSGVYFYQAVAGTYTESRKMLLLK